jgi:hypothetical protein
VRHTQIYAKLVDEKKQEAVKKLPSLWDYTGAVKRGISEIL